MKYIKKFENIKEYKIGDIVVFYYTKYGVKKEYISEIFAIDDSPFMDKENRYEYKVKLGVNTFNEDTTAWIIDSNIIRKATKEETEKFELDRDTKKYNI